MISTNVKYVSVDVYPTEKKEIFLFKIRHNSFQLQQGFLFHKTAFLGDAIIFLYDSVVAPAKAALVYYPCPSKVVSLPLHPHNNYTQFVTVTMQRPPLGSKINACSYFL